MSETPPSQQKPKSFRRRLAGFTLIELMVVIAIIGILASMAIPSFNDILRKSKRAELVMNQRQFINTMKDYLGVHGRWPSGTADSSFISTAWNPNPTAPYGKKKPWRKNEFPWNAFTFEPEGWVYYSYYLYGDKSVGSNPNMYVYTMGDLDNDGNICYCAVWLELNRGVWVPRLPYDFDYCWNDDW